MESSDPGPHTHPSSAQRPQGHQAPGRPRAAPLSLPPGLGWRAGVKAVRAINKANEEAVIRRPLPVTLLLLVPPASQTRLQGGGWTAPTGGPFVLSLLDARQGGEGKEGKGEGEGERALPPPVPAALHAAHHPPDEICLLSRTPEEGPSSSAVDTPTFMLRSPPSLFLSLPLSSSDSLHPLFAHSAVACFPPADCPLRHQTP